MLVEKLVGKCWLCGKAGHKKVECWYDVSNGGTGLPPPPKRHQVPRPKANSKAKAFKGECNYCKIEGHKERDCRKKKFVDAAKEESQE
eukprot:6093717-Karenia_brevis.AAC.1